MRTRIPDILLAGTLTLEKLTPEQQRIVEARHQASVVRKHMGQGNRNGLAAVKISTLNSAGSTKSLPEGSTALLRRSEKPRLYGLHQRIRTAKLILIRKLR